MYYKKGTTIDGIRKIHADQNVLKRKAIVYRLEQPCMADGFL